MPETTAHLDRSGGKDVTFGPPDAGLRFASVTHDILGDPFWAVYRRGLADAAERFGCRIHHLAPQRFSPAAMAGQLRTAVDERPDGILATVPDAEVVEGPLREAIALGIPVIAVNAADPRPPERRIPYLCYVGADDVTGGRTAAERINSIRAPRQALCVDHYLIEHACHLARAEGFAARLAEDGIPCETLRVPGDDIDGSASAIATHLRDHPGIDALCTLGPPGCAAAIQALEQLGRLDDVLHASFDLAPEQLAAVAAGRLSCTIDSQQYLQGYLGATLLHLHATHAFVPGGDVLTGPAIVDAGNVAAVSESVESGVR